jgi:hypothetical protein
VNDLVVRLSKPQAVEASLRPERSLRLFQGALDRGFVLIRFVETDTELGVRLDPTGTDTSQADFAAGRGKVRLAGELVLNYVRVRCHAEIDLVELRGKGHLEVLGEVTAAALAKERVAQGAK